MLTDEKCTKVQHQLTVFRLLLALLVIGSASSASPRRDIAGFWTLELKPGFNLVAFPVLPDDATPSNIFREAFAEGLGSVEISVWDRGLGGYRQARFDAASGGWSGDLYRLDRGAAYWVNLPEADGTRQLVVTGHPEEYVKFRWESLGTGWRFYAPVFGKEQPLDELPPDGETDLLLAWNSEFSRFETATATTDGHWLASDIAGFKPDRAYLVHRRGRPLRSVAGDAAYYSRDRLGLTEGEAGRQTPPLPMVAGNWESLPICYENGDACNGSFVVRVVRERMRIGLGGELEPVENLMGNYRVAMTVGEAGRFRLALTVGSGDEFLRAGDRVHLLVLGSGGAQTQSSSFEIPDDGNFITDVSFPNPLTTPEGDRALPREFAVGNPFPNPFNDRFQLELTLPQTALVSYALYDLTGRAAVNASLPLAAGSHRLTLPAGQLPAGVYVLAVSDGANRAMLKVAHVK